MAVVGEIVKNVLSCLGPDLEEKTNDLQRKVEWLESRKDDVWEELGGKAAYLHGKKRKREVEYWLFSVKCITTGFETLKEDVESCRVYKRQMLTEQVEQMTKVVTELLEQSDFPKGLFLEVDASDYLDQPTYTANKFMDYFWELVWNDSLSKIGIWETGKSLATTTLSEQINDKLSNKSTCFGHVCQVRVSQEFSTYKLQGDIAHALNLDLSCENDERERATILSKAFKKKGRSLLILDDVREQIDIEKIGIPVGKGCKLIITSRSKEVCQQMKCQRIIQVSKVSEQEACELLLKKLGSVQPQQ